MRTKHLRHERAEGQELPLCSSHATVPTMQEKCSFSQGKADAASSRPKVPLEEISIHLGSQLLKSGPNTMLEEMPERMTWPGVVIVVMTVIVKKAHVSNNLSFCFGKAWELFLSLC